MQRKGYDHFTRGRPVRLHPGQVAVGLRLDVVIDHDQLPPERIATVRNAILAADVEHDYQRIPVKRFVRLRILGTKKGHGGGIVLVDDQHLFVRESGANNALQSLCGPDGVSIRQGVARKHDPVISADLF